MIFEAAGRANPPLRFLARDHWGKCYDATRYERSEAPSHVCMYVRITFNIYDADEAGDDSRCELWKSGRPIRPKDESRLAPHSKTAFWTTCQAYSSSAWSRARSFAKVTDKITVRSSFMTISDKNNTVWRLPVIWTTTVRRDVLIVALDLRVNVIPACTRHFWTISATVLTHMEYGSSSILSHVMIRRTNQGNLRHRAAMICWSKVALLPLLLTKVRVSKVLACKSTHMSLVLTGFSTLCWYPQILLLWIAKGLGKASRNPTAWSLFANHTISSRQLAVDVRAGRIRPGKVTTTSKPHNQSFRDNKSEPLPLTDLSEELFGGELAQHNPRIPLARLSDTHLDCRP